MEGWIKLHRKLIEWEWYSDINVKVVFLHCLLKANIKDCTWRGIEISRGQFFSSNASLSAEIGLSIKEIRNSLKKLEKTGELTLFGTSEGTKITVCNYDSYQVLENTTGKRWASEGQARGKQRATDREEEEEIEGKEELNNSSSNGEKQKKSKPKFTTPTLQEVQAYCLERKNNVEPSQFIDFYESKGWVIGKNKMKDWKAAVRTWEKNSKSNGQQQQIKTGSSKDWNALGKYEEIKRRNEQQNG